MSSDARSNETHAKVSEYLQRLHKPAFGRPHGLSEVHVTADGTDVVVTGSVLDKLIGKPRTAIYTVAEGGLRAVTGPTSSARGGRFSPDGTALAFLSDRAQTGVFQPFVLDARTLGEADPVAPVPGTVEHLHWSPDGRHLLLGVAGIRALLSAGQGSGPIAALSDDGPAWQPVVDDGLDSATWRSLWLYTVGTGELSRLSPEGMNCWEAAWCGSSKVVAVASEAPGEDDWYDAVLSMIDVATGATQALVSDHRLHENALFGLPAGSPDGRYVSFVEAVCSDRWIVAGELTIVDLDSGVHSIVDTGGTDVTCTQWIDANHVGYLGQRHLDSVVGVIDVATNEVTELFSTPVSCSDGRYPAGAFTRDGRVAVVQSAYDLPPQVVLLGAEKEEVLASTAHAGTDFLLSVAGTARAITWQAPDGRTIEGILCSPSGDGPFPLVVNIHGGPIAAFRNSWLMHYPWVPMLVAEGYAVLNPNPRGSGGRGQEFARQVIGDMGGADAADILAGIDALVVGGVIDEERIGLIGRSYGGFMTSWLVTQDQRFAAAIPIAPITDWYSKCFTSNTGRWARTFLRADPEEFATMAHSRNPVLQASKVRTPCLNVAGALDRCTPPGQAQEFHQALRYHGQTDSVLAIYPQEGHGIASYPALTDFLVRALSWFNQYMPAAPVALPDADAPTTATTANVDPRAMHRSVST